MNHIAKIKRVRELLSFDLAFLGSEQQTSVHRQYGQIPLNLEAPRGGAPAANLGIVGFDEAGRGSLAGPVTVACVHFDWKILLALDGGFRNAILESYADLNDSKQVTKRNREHLYGRILAEALCGIGCASAPEIDQLGIVASSCLAANRAYRNLQTKRPECGFGADIGLFDRGLSLGEEEGEASIPFTVQITKGDGKSFHIAAASILAKVWRDAILCDLDSRAEGYGFAEPYGFASHKGYGSVAHIEAIRKYGPSKFHRKTFLTRI